MIPRALQDLLDASLAAVRAHPQHALTPIHRWNIYIYLGPVSIPAGLRRRGFLALGTAYHVLPIWQEEHSDNRAERLLALAEGVLLATCDAKVAGEEAERAWQWLTDDHGGRYERLSMRAYFAFGAIAQAVFAAIEGDSWDHFRFEDNETDADIDIWSSDTAKWAVNAAAGPVWESGSDDVKRLEFWTWWLTTAVPEAWEAVE